MEACAVFKRRDSYQEGLVQVSILEIGKMETFRDKLIKYVRLFLRWVYHSWVRLGGNGNVV